MTLNEQQKKRIQTSFQSGNFNLNSEIENLITQGFSREEAANKIQAEVTSYREKLFEQKVKAEESEDYGKIAMFVVVMVGLIGPIFNITSFIWYLIACSIAGAVGYWAYKDKPMAGLTGCICAVIMLPITYNWYISGRSSIIKIELLIPIGLALIPSFLIGLLISKLLYQIK